MSVFEVVRDIQAGARTTFQLLKGIAPIQRAGSVERTIRSGLNLIHHCCIAQTQSEVEIGHNFRFRISQVLLVFLVVADRFFLFRFCFRFFLSLCFCAFFSFFCAFSRCFIALCLFLGIGFGCRFAFFLCLAFLSLGCFLFLALSFGFLLFFLAFLRFFLLLRSCSLLVGLGCRYRLRHCVHCNRSSSQTQNNTCNQYVSKYVFHIRVLLY